MAEWISKRGRSRKPLTPLIASDINISAKENQDGLSAVKSKRVFPKPDFPERSLVNDLQDMQRRFHKLTLEKAKTEELLTQRDEILKQKEVELENHGKEHERLQKELRKLQKLKFNPTMSIPLVKSLREKEQEKQNKKLAKKKKGTQKMKKPCSAYILWCKDKWTETRKDNPNADFKEISAAMGAKWKNLSAEDKQPYEDKYRVDKEAYNKIVGQEKRESDAMKLLEEEQMQKTAMELLQQYLQFRKENVEEGKKLRKENDPLKPKKPMSAFFLFATERRADLPQENKNICAVAKIAGEEWNNMTKEKKAPFEEMARQLKDEYNQQMELYMQKKLEEAASIEKDEDEQKKVLKQEALQLLKKKEKTNNIIKKARQRRQKAMKLKLASEPNKPKKPASSFFLFSKETRKQLLQERPAMEKSALVALVSVKWKELTEAQKQVWNDKAEEGMVVYRGLMEEYNKFVANTSNNQSTDHE